MRIVIADAHLPAALTLIRELGRGGHEVWAVCDSDRKPLGLKSKFVSRGIHLAEGLGAAGKREALLNILHDSTLKPIFIPLSRETVAMTAKHRKYFDLQCWTLVPEPEDLAITQDKRKLYKLAESLEIAVPPTVKFLENESVADFAYRQPAPIILKYYDGEKLFLPPQRRYTLAKPGREIYKRYSIMHDVQNPVLTQEFVGGDSYGVGLVLDNDSRPVSVLCVRRVREYPHTGGPGTLIESAWAPRMADAAVKLAAALKLSGFAYAEFKGNPDVFTLMDMSPRAWHGLPMAGVCGLSIGQAYMWAAMSGTPPHKTLAPRYELGCKMQFPLADLRAGAQYLINGRPLEIFCAVGDLFRPSVKWAT
ncbi:hypothetical protein FACS1894202_05040 [Clostridia bacterium]|nr:hypothetical protein FACS1894202_05040 [Clostridia bacterium]